MNEPRSTAVTLMIQAGAVPENVLNQLVHWRLIPETVTSSPGSLSHEKQWDSVEDFVSELKAALDKEHREIRETELGAKRHEIEVRLIHRDPEFEDSRMKAEEDLLGRVIIPAKPTYRTLSKVQILRKGEPVKDIFRIETRYKGDQEVEYVLYFKERESYEGAQ